MPLSCLATEVASSGSHDWDPIQHIRGDEEGLIRRATSEEEVVVVVVIVVVVVVVV